MVKCPYCGQMNYDRATECRKCQGRIGPETLQTIFEDKSYWMGPEKAKVLRSKALSAVVIGLLVKVYWGGYGPWPVIDYAPWAEIRPWLDPWLIYGGALLYLIGWVLNWI